MSRYRKIDVKMWGDEKFCALSKAQPNGQSLWQYLLTGPHSTGCPGIFHIGEMGLCENLNWPIKAFRKVFAELLEKGMVKADWKSKVIVIPNVLRYDDPQSPNVIKKWAKDFDQIPECELKVEYYQIIEEFIKNLGEAFDKAFQQAFQKPLLKTSGIPLPLPLPEPLPNPLPDPEDLATPDNLFRLFLETCKNLRRPKELNKSRRDSLTVRIKEHPNITWWKEVFEMSDLVLIPEKDGRKSWSPDIDWLIKNDTNALKVLEGKYTTRSDRAPLFKPQPGIADFYDTEKRKEGKHDA